MNRELRTFSHHPAGAHEHEMTLWAHWDTDEPEHLSCTTCGAMWPVGARVPLIPTCYVCPDHARTGGYESCCECGGWTEDDPDRGRLCTEASDA